MPRELVDLETIAQRLGYSLKYMQNSWPELLVGIQPLKLGVNRAIRFYWEDIEKLLLQPK